MLADSTSAAHCNGWDFDTPVRKEPRDVLAPEVMSPHGPKRRKTMSAPMSAIGG